MAIGARITSNNLSGKTATVTFVPYTGSTSGNTVNLGTKTVPFNHINSHPYGIYSLYFDEYDYTYTLTVPEPDPVGVQLFIYSDRMVSSDNYGAVTLNFNDFTAEIIDLDANINDWNNNNIYSTTENGVMYYFRGTNNSSDRLVVFTDSSNAEIGRYSGTTSSFSRNSLDGKWVTAEFNDLGVFKYSDGISLYTYDWDPETHNIDVEWDYDAITSDGTFIIKKYELGSWNYNGNGSSYIINPDTGVSTSFKTWTDGEYVRHKMNPSSNFIAVESQDQTNNNRYTKLEIFDTSGTLLETVSLTGDTYNNNYTQFHGTNKFTTVYYNDGDVDVDYKIIHYNGNTNTLIETSHVRGMNYYNLTLRGNSDFWPSSQGLNNGAVFIGLYNQTSNDNVGIVTTYCDFVYMLDGQSSFNTYVFADDQTKSFTPWDIQLSDIIRLVCDNGDGVVSYLTIRSGGTIVESMNKFKTDVNSIGYRWLGNKTVVQLMTNNYSDVTYNYINTNGSVTDTITYSLSSQWGTSMTNFGEVCYIKINSSNDGDIGFYVYGNNVDFNSTTYYNNQQTPDYYDSETKELPDAIFLYSEGGGTGRMLTSTGVTSQFQIPEMNSYNTRMGKDKFMIVYQDFNDNNYIKFKLYDFSGTLLNSQSTTYTSWNNSWGAKDRFVVSFYDGNNNTNVFYLVSETNIASVTTQNYDSNTEINDYIWND